MLSPSVRFYMSWLILTCGVPWVVPVTYADVSEMPRQQLPVGVMRTVSLDLPSGRSLLSGSVSPACKVGKQGRFNWQSVLGSRMLMPRAVANAAPASKLLVAVNADGQPTGKGAFGTTDIQPPPHEKIAKCYDEWGNYDPCCGDYCCNNPTLPPCCDPFTNPSCDGYCSYYPTTPPCCDPNTDPNCEGYCSYHDPNTPPCCDPNTNPNCEGYCSYHPTTPPCCDPNMDPACEGYCSYHPTTPPCCDPNTDPNCEGYCSYHPTTPPCCDPITDSACEGYCSNNPTTPPCCDPTTDSACAGYCSHNPQASGCCDYNDPSCIDYCNHNTCYSVTPHAGSGGTISPSTVQIVIHGNSATFVITPDTGYLIDHVEGCDGGLSANTYTTGPIYGSCEVNATFRIKSYLVSTTANPTTGGTFTPSSRLVEHGQPASFTIAPQSCYKTTAVSGCGGALASSTFTTGPITGSCTISGTFSLKTYKVTPTAGSGGAITPNTLQTVGCGSTPSFTIEPDATHDISAVTGCNGTLSGNTYTSGPITANCTITATFALKSYEVTLIAGVGGTILNGDGTTVATPLQVQHGSTATLKIQPDTGYNIATVSGCGGSLSGDSYVTGTVTAPCTINAEFSRKVYSVTTNIISITSTGTTAPNGGSIDPTSASVLHGDNTLFTLIPLTGYNTTSVSGCEGSLDGNTYTTGPITANCAVTVTFTLQTYAVNISANSGGTVHPNVTVSVDHGATTQFTVTPDPGYTVKDSHGCDGNLVDVTYTTGPITAACDVIVEFFRATPLTSGLTIGNQNVELDAWQYYFINVPEGSENLTLTTTNATADLDIRASANGIPDLDGADCIADSTSGDETCNIINPTPGRWWLGVYGYEASNYSVTGLVSTAGIPIIATANPATAGSINCNPNPVLSGGNSTCIATPAFGYNFSHFSGDCSGSTCELLNVTSYKAIVANFEPQQYTLTITKTGSGIGTINSDVTGIDCGTDCAEPYDYNAAVTLTATATADSTFGGWSVPSCVDNVAQCMINVDGNLDVIANFETNVPTTCGATWIPRTSGLDSSYPIYGVVWAGNQFVAVAAGSKVITSNDGATWQVRNAPANPPRQISGITWSGQKLVAVAGVNDESWIYASADAITWTERSIEGRALRSLVWNGDLNMLIAVGENGTIITSDAEATNWTPAYSDTNYLLNAITSVGDKSIAVGDGSTIVTSTDGINWNKPQTPSSSLSLSTALWNGSQFLAAGGSTILTSTDGETWEELATTGIPSGFTFLNIIWNGSRYFAAGNTGILTSVDGKIWSQIATSTASLRSLAWSGSNLVAVGNGGVVLHSSCEATQVSTGVQVSYDPVPTAQDLTVNAIVEATGSNQSPTGNVDFFVNGTRKATYYDIAPGTGARYAGELQDSDKVEAEYLGDDSFEAVRDYVEVDRPIGLLTKSTSHSNALVVSIAGMGKVVTPLAPWHIDCTGDCQQNYSKHRAASVTLRAIPNSGSAFNGWSGSGCSGTSDTCTVTMDQARTITATFATLGAAIAPSASTDPASNVTTTSATLKGWVNDNGAATTISFDFGTTTSYGTNIPATPGTITANTGGTAVTVSRTGLTCGTKYYYRAKAENSIGTTYGLERSFTTTSTNCPAKPFCHQCLPSMKGWRSALTLISELPNSGRIRTMAIHKVTPSAGTGGTVSPNNAQTVNHGTTKAFTVTPNTGYSKNTVVAGTCPQGTWSDNIWTTGAITANCTVEFTFTINTTSYTVTPSVGTGGTVSPNNAQTVNYGTTKAFTVTPNTGYSKNTVVAGTCPQGSWSDNTWTTGAITANCTVDFGFTLNTYTVTPSTGTGGTVSPNNAQTLNHGATKAFIVTPNKGYSRQTNVSGTCPQGSWSGEVWITGPITANCTVAFSFLCQICLPSMQGWRGALALIAQLPNTRRPMMVHKITPSAGAGGTIIPNTMRLVLTGTKSMFTITPVAGNTATVTGTCGGIPTTGTAAFTYTTNPVSRDCTIEVSFVATLNKAAIDTTVDTADTKVVADLPAWQDDHAAANSHTMGRTNGIADLNTQTLPTSGSSAFDFTKLDANGQDLPAEAEDYTCLRDNATDLIWEAKTQDGGLQDQNWSYTWYDANKPGGHTGTASGGICYTVGRCDSEKYTHDINARGLCGGKDWRLPTIAELATIANSQLTQYQPPTWAAFDPSLVDGYNAMVVDFATGHIDPLPRSVGNAIMLVRKP